MKWHPLTSKDRGRTDRAGSTPRTAALGPAACRRGKAQKATDQRRSPVDSACRTTAPHPRSGNVLALPEERRDRCAPEILRALRARRCDYTPTKKAAEAAFCAVATLATVMPLPWSFHRSAGGTSQRDPQCRQSFACPCRTDGTPSRLPHAAAC